MVEEKEGIPRDRQRFIFMGQQLDNQRTMDEYHVVEGSTLHIVLRLVGD